MKRCFGISVSGAGAGILNGLLGAGGGMVLVPLMSKLTDLEEKQLFSHSVAIIFPICIVSLLFAQGWSDFSLPTTLPYLLGSLLGGICAVFWGKYIPASWLHKGLGALILWGGIRYLCSNG